MPISPHPLHRLMLMQIYDSVFKSIQQRRALMNADLSDTEAEDDEQWD